MQISLEPQVEPLVQLGVAMLYGGLLGLEREAHGRAAGLRTMILVCVASTLIMIVSAQIAAASSHLNEAVTRVDPGRIAAGIVTGIGFLGGAVVIKLGDLVRGVTTAACIWFAAGLGISIGQGYYWLSTFATGIALIVLWLLQYVDKWISAPTYRRVSVELTGDQRDVQAEIEAIFEKYHVRTMDLHAATDTTAGVTELLFHIRSRGPSRAPDVVRKLSGLPGVRRVRWH